MAESYDEQIRAATHVLEAIAKDRSLLAALPLNDRTRLLTAAGDVYSPDVEARRRQIKAERRQRKADRVDRDQMVLAGSGIRTLRAKPVFTTPNVFLPEPWTEPDDLQDEHAGDHDEEHTGERHCYVCKRLFTEVHHFYDQMCPECADFNFAKRGETADLTGRVALVTGGRVKIGYQAGIKLLRAGAELIITTRFPRDCATRYASEPDASEWIDRVEVFGLDLRHTPSVDAFCHHILDTRQSLDFIVNNACQTVRRPPEFYAHMMALESASVRSPTSVAQQLVGGFEGVGGYSIIQSDAALPVLASTSDLFPAGRLDQDLQQIDLRDNNSWRLTLAEVSSVELLETQLVNAVAPFVLNARLKPLMLRTPTRDKHIVNVSAVEGQFYRRLKTTRHPHTNMAKAALNMMTRTSAADYHADGIHMNSVDTGWVSDEDPAHIALRKSAEHRFHPPLDIVDGAARIVDPIISGVNTGQHLWGTFLKDYKPTNW